MKKLLVALGLLVASAFIGAGAPAMAQQDPVSFCHSGNGKNFTFITTDDDGWAGHEAQHEHDFLADSEKDCEDASDDDDDDDDDDDKDKDKDKDNEGALAKTGV